MLAFIVAVKLPLERRGKEGRQYKPRCRKFKCRRANLGSKLSLLLFSHLMIHYSALLFSPTPLTPP